MKTVQIIQASNNVYLLYAYSVNFKLRTNYTNETRY